MFSCAEILKVVSGKLVNGSAQASVRGISTDSRTIRAGEAFLAIKGKNFDGHDYIDRAAKKGASCIIKEKKNKNKVRGNTACIEVRDTLKALGDIAGAWRKRFNIPVIAVSGSNGKTTAKDMIAWVLSRKFRVLKNEGTKNNQVGLPLTVLKLDDRYNMMVLELGTNHPGEIEYLVKIAQPDIGVITNIGPAHLEHFGSLSGVFKEKIVLIRNLKSPAIAVLNADDRFLKEEIAGQTKLPFVLGFGIKNQSDFFASAIAQQGRRLTFCVNRRQEYKLNTAGYNNVYNALIASAIARIFGLGYADISARLRCFDFPAGRLKFVRRGNVNFIDDTYNSNPASLKHALEALDKFRTCGRKIMVIGDMLELGRKARAFHIQAGRDAAKVCDYLIAVGRLSKLAAVSARSCGLSPENIFTCMTSRQAAGILRTKLSAGKDDIILVKGSRAMKMEEILK
ncbi:MAG: UDP-N-acetylmuramoyl-tripeptide--D-alanyl-D-alanine ligase [Candidatus Omnitrophica bacterium]|nr:UDP-N-acetylmuramoyl-tripeptide--D-alanyl-D-alanine ligase [Candidatus Omnitrophota bacterium]